MEGYTARIDAGQANLSDSRKIEQPLMGPAWPLGFAPMPHGTHDFEDDARNERILIWVNGELVPRERAVVSVFDAGFVLGDGVWEGLRVLRGSRRGLVPAVRGLRGPQPAAARP